MGENVGIGKDHTIYSKIDGVVRFEPVSRSKRRISVYPPDVYPVGGNAGLLKPAYESVVFCRGEPGRLTAVSSHFNAVSVAELFPHMKPGIHPQYIESTVICACGNTFTTRSTKPQLRTDLCNVCHPFYTGEQRIVDTAGQVRALHEAHGDGRRYVATDEAPGPNGPLARSGMRRCAGALSQKRKRLTQALRRPGCRPRRARLRNVLRNRTSAWRSATWRTSLHCVDQFDVRAWYGRRA